MREPGRPSPAHVEGRGAGLRRARSPLRAVPGLLPWLAAGLALTVHLVALYLPGSPDGPALSWLPGADKVVHVLLFAVPASLLGRLTRRVGLVAGGFAVHAVVSELVQWRFVPYRDGDPVDALADLVGIGLAVLLLQRRPGR